MTENRNTGALDAQARAVLSAQAAVVGALLIDPGICGELFAEVREDDLVTAEYRSVYKAARELFFDGKPVDSVTVLDRLGGGPNARRFLGELIEITPSAANWREYAALLCEQARLWRLQGIGRQLAEAVTLEEARQLVGQAQAEGSDLGQRRAVTMREGLVDFYQRITQPVKYLRFGNSLLDRKIYASLGDFIILGGRPSSGKTLLSVQMADVLSREYRVGYFSLETGPRKLFDRFVTQAVPLDFGRVKRHELTEDDMHALAYRNKEISSRSLEIIPAGGYTVDDIRAETLSGRYQIIFVDYLQLVRTSGKKLNRTEEVGEVSRGLHTLAQQHGITVIALAQLSRPERGLRRPPQLSDLRESGQIEQDADIVLMLSLVKDDDSNESGGNTDRALQILKNKEGELARIRLAFDGRAQQLVERMQPNNRRQKPRPQAFSRSAPKPPNEPEQLGMEDGGNE